MATNSESVSVVIMAFNEVLSLESVVREIDSECAALNRPYEVVIVDDGSTDGTSALADSLGAELANVRAIHHDGNQGLGAVYRTGFEQARCDMLTFYPADGQFPARIIGQFVPLMQGVGMVLGYLPQPKRSLIAQGLSVGERILYRILFGGDLPRFQGVFMMRRSLLEGMELRSTDRSWTILMEFLVKANRKGCKYVSAPTEIRPRMHGTSKVNNLATIWANLKHAVALRGRL